MIDALEALAYRWDDSSQDIGVRLLIDELGDDDRLYLASSPGRRSMLPNQMLELTNEVLSAQLKLAQALARASLNGMSKLNHLNTSTACTALAESQVIMHALMGARDPQDAAALLQAQWSPNAAKALAYGRHLALISSALQDECRQAALSQLAHSRSSLQRAEAENETEMPAEAEAMQAMRSAVDTAGGAWLQITDAARQSRDAMQQTIDAALHNWLGENSRRS